MKIRDKGILSIVITFSLIFSVIWLSIIPISAAYITDGEGFSIAGDVNNDGEVDIIDLVRLKKIIADTADGNRVACDLDGSGIADGGDLVLLTVMLLGVDRSAWSKAY